VIGDVEPLFVQMWSARKYCNLLQWLKASRLLQKVVGPCEWHWRGLASGEFLDNQSLVLSVLTGLIRAL
jgi:hypothetical protein